MRLIDADALKTTRSVAVDNTEGKVQLFTERLYRQETIDNAPTVEAIPVNWIRKQAEDAANNHLYPEIVETALVEMIEDWREKCAKQQSTTSE